jgi:electron transport complex protein RnfC
VTGNGVKNPKNLKVPIGMKFGEILNLCDYNKEVTEKIVMGGPMMGIAQYTEEVPVIKGVSGILALTKQEINDYKTRPCILCGKCVAACPLGLVPLMFGRLSAHEEWDKMEKYRVLDCMQCGSCQYICPSNRPLTESIVLGKTKIKAKIQKS